jgi:hypothetical protein
MSRPALRRARAAVALGAALTTLLLGQPAAEAIRRAPAPADPVPTARNPLQGLRRLTVATIPPVPGVRFAVDGREFVSDANGLATTVVTKSQRLAVRNARDQHLTVATPVVEHEPGVRARFAGWSGEGQYRGGGQMPEEYQRATFDVEYLTNFEYTTSEGASIDAATVDSMELRSSTGELIVVRSSAPVWLTGSLAAAGPQGLQVRSVSYAIDSVTTSGASVVNRAQQRFFPSRRETVDVPLLLFDVGFVVQDGFFPRPAGSALTLEYPDGTKHRFPLDSQGRATVRRLPRGTYRATVSGAGPAFSQELTVSSAAPIELEVLTWLDTALLGGLVLLVAASVFGAGWALRRRRRHAGAAVAEDTAHPRPEMIGAS